MTRTPLRDRIARRTIDSIADGGPAQSGPAAFGDPTAVRKPAWLARLTAKDMTRLLS